MNKLQADNFAKILKQADLASQNTIEDFIKKIDFDEKLKAINKKVT